MGIDYGRGPDVTALALCIPDPGRALPSPPDPADASDARPLMPYQAQIRRMLSQTVRSFRSVRAVEGCLRALRGTGRCGASITIRASADEVAGAARWLSEHVIDAFTDRATYQLGGRRHEVVRTVLILRGRA